MSVNKLVLIEHGEYRVWFDPTTFVCSKISSYDVSHGDWVQDECNGYKRANVSLYKLDVHLYGTSSLTFSNLQSREKAIELEEIFINEVKEYYDI